MNTSTSVDSGGVAEGRHTSAAGGVRRTAWRASPGTKTGQLHPGCKRRTEDAHGLEGALLWRVTSVKEYFEGVSFCGVASTRLTAPVTNSTNTFASWSHLSRR